MIETVSKEELIDLIEAYAAAQKTANTTLVTLAVGAVKQVIERLYAPVDGFEETRPQSTSKTPIK